MQIQKIKQFAKKLIQHIKILPVKFWVFCSIALLVVIYVILFILPTHITYSFSNKQYCTNKLILLPDIQQQTTGKNDFEITKSGFVKIGNFKLLSNKICVSPVKAPTSGTTNINLAPLGGIIFSSKFAVKIGDIPKLSAVSSDKPQAIAKPLEFNLTQADGLFEYQLTINNKTAKCNNNSKIVSCTTSNLGLEQGKTYAYKLIRMFDGKIISTELTSNLSLLPPVSVTATSVTDNEMVYSKPKQFTITADKNIKTADVSIVKVAGDTTAKIESNQSISGNVINLSITNDLERKANYRLVINSIESTDGSTLVAPKNINFKTSSGPNVTNINIGTSAINANATIIITFDQTIEPSMDVTKYIAFSGGSVGVSHDNNTISLKLNNLPVCQAFSISVNKGLISSNGVASDANWSYNSRVNCRVATETIGYSVNGRPIIAYYYGSGSTTILFTGGIHGSEFSGKYILDDWSSYLDSYAYQIPSDKRVVVVPSLNPDGIASGNRYNAHNVNIDRNFDTANWKADIDTSSGTVINGGGTTVMSEPETVAIANFTARLMPRLEVSYHAQGSLVGANQYADSINIGNLYASSIGYSSMIGNAEEVMGYSLTGEYEDWMGEKYGIPAILIELPDTSGHYLQSNLSTMWKIVNI